MQNTKIKPQLKQAILYCMIQKLENKETLEYLATKGFKISQTTLTKKKRIIKETQFSRLSDIAKDGFMSQHLERIDQCELVIKLMWENYHKEENPSKKVTILNTIIEAQPYLSNYYEASKEIMEGQVNEADIP